MPSKITRDFLCNNCGAEYMLTYDEDNIMEDPCFCPFCGPKNILLEIDEILADTDILCNDNKKLAIIDPCCGNSFHSFFIFTI